jgi:hypothetical protein
MQIDFSTLRDRAASDPRFFDRLVADPVGTCREAGYEVSADSLKELLGVPDVADEQLGDVLLSRLSSD